MLVFCHSIGKGETSVQYNDIVYDLSNDNHNRSVVVRQGVGITTMQ